MHLCRSVLICLRNSQLNHARGKMKEELATDTLRVVKAGSWVGKWYSLISVQYFYVGF